MNSPLLAQLRAGLSLTTPPEGLGEIEARLWSHLDGRRSVSELVALVSTEQAPVSAAQVWSALDVLADLGFMAQRVAPPAAETVSRHQPLGRRQWALAGLAMAAAPMAFAATAAATEEKAKGDARSMESSRKQMQEQDTKARRTTQEEDVKARRTSTEEDMKARRSTQEEERKASSAQGADLRAAEQQKKSEARAGEQKQKLQARSTEQEEKRAQALTRQSAEETAKK
jgi:hypothetical protein